MKKQPYFKLLKSQNDNALELHLELPGGAVLVFDCRAPRRIVETGHVIEPTGETIGSHEVVLIEKSSCLA